MPLPYTFVNWGEDILGASMTSITTLLTPATPSLFPATNTAQMAVVCESEIMLTTDTRTVPWTVARGQFGTAQAAHTPPARLVAGHIIADALAAFLQSDASGSGLTSLAATKLTGTIADARLSANVPLLSSANIFAALQTIAGLAVTTATKTANYTLTTTDVVIIANAASLTLTLPAAATAKQVVLIKNGASGSGTLVNVAGGGTIDGATSFTGVDVPYASNWFISNGTEWMVA